MNTIEQPAASGHDDERAILTDPANADELSAIRDYLSDLLDVVTDMHRVACESLNAIQAMAERQQP